MNGKFGASGMACMWYAMWYKEDVSPNMTREQKEKLLKKLSAMSLETPIFDTERVELDEFPELKPFAHTGAFSGLQLYTVMSEIFDEISNIKLEKTYPTFPTKRGD